MPIRRFGVRLLCGVLPWIGFSAIAQLASGCIEHRASLRQPEELRMFTAAVRAGRIAMIKLFAKNGAYAVPKLVYDGHHANHENHETQRQGSGQGRYA